MSLLPLRMSSTGAPVTSEGNKSGVHWIRVEIASIDVDNARAIIVLPVPGMSSSRQ